MTEEKTTTSKNNKLTVIIALLALSLIGNVFQAVKSSSYKKETVEKIEGLTEQYDSISVLFNESMDMVEQFKADNQKLSSDVEEKIASIMKLKEEVEHLKKTEKDQAKLLKALKEKYAQIQKLNAELEQKIDELLVENQRLFKANDSLKINVETLSEEAKVLEEKVNTGSKLKAEYFDIITYKKRGGGKYKETKLARRARKIEVNFTLLENAIAEKGEKTVCLSIIAPSGKVLGSSNMSKNLVELENMNGKVKYTTSKEYTCTGEKQVITLSYEEGDENYEFEAGLYKVEIYVDNYVSGKSTFDLK